MQSNIAPSSSPAALGTVNWRVALERLFTAFMTSDASSTSKWDKTDPVLSMITHTTSALFGVDYDVDVIDNDDGQICATYPPKMYFLKGSKGGQAVQQVSCLREPLHHGARFGRVRTRYPMPVLLFRGKNVCRSSSLTMRLEALVQTTHNSIRDTFGYSDASSTPTSPEQMLGNGTYELGMYSAEIAELRQMLQSEQSSAMDKHRLADITLIRGLRVSHIADLMLENSKKLMGLALCSSEKNDSYKRYADFTLLVLPYPGVEFFREFNPDQPERAQSMYFNWTPWPPVTRPPGSLSYDHATICQWDVITITSNYLKTILYSLCDPSCTGLLVHCISGWDRTPLFVALLRLSLWADGEIHESLTPEQMLYLTVSYDWMLFRHQLALRQANADDIFAFCYLFLEHIIGPEFAVPIILERLGKGSANTRIPSPSPVWKPSILSYVGGGSESPSVSSALKTKHLSSSSSTAGSNHASPSSSRSTTKSTTPKRISSAASMSVEMEGPKKSLLDGLIISSYHGNSTFEDAMEPMRQLDDIIIRTVEDSDEDDSVASTIESDNSSGPSSFKPLSFGMDDAAPSFFPSATESPATSLKLDHSTHVISPPTSQKDISTGENPTEEDHLLMAHPLAEGPIDDKMRDTAPVDPLVKYADKLAERKRRLTEVSRVFKEYYKRTMQPYFTAKRQSASHGIWSWLPSFGLGSNSNDAPKRS